MVDTQGHLNWNTLFKQDTADEALKQALIFQLEKDLNQHFEELNPQDLFEAVYRSVSKLIESNGLSELLYRVDISEEQATVCMNSGDPVFALTQTILKREAQKVIFRRQYSG